MSIITKQMKSSMLLLIAAIIWGVTLVAQSVGMDYIGPFTFNTTRCFVGGVVLAAYIFLFKNHDRIITKGNKKTLFIGGILCGLVLGVATNLQQLGIQYSTVGKAGFITTLYIVIVPLFGLIFKKIYSATAFFSVMLSLVGLYFLCISKNFVMGMGDIYLLLCALAFAAHILIIDHFSPIVDGIKMSCIQFFACAVFSGALMIIFEDPKITMILKAWGPILYAGGLSCGIAYTLQILAQKDLRPTVASIIMSFESVISVLAGWILLNQHLTVREFVGCLLMFIAIISIQFVPERKVKHPTVKELP